MDNKNNKHITKVLVGLLNTGLGGIKLLKGFFPVEKEGKIDERNHLSYRHR